MKERAFALHRKGLALLLATGPLVAAQAATIHVLPGQPGMSKLAEPIAPDVELKKLAQLPTANDTTTRRMQQTYQDLPVYGFSIAEEIDLQGNIRQRIGRWADNIDQDVASLKPAIDPAQATSALAAGQRSAASMKFKFHLIIYIDNAQRARLAYLIDIAESQPLARRKGIVDAQNGELLVSWNALAKAQRKVKGPGGNERTGIYWYGIDRPWLLASTTNKTTCNLNTRDVETYHLQGGDTFPQQPYAFRCSTQNQDQANGAYSPLNDAHALAHRTLAMYKAYGLDVPIPLPLKIGAHLGAPGPNAFWTGEGVILSDGDSNWFPTATPGVVGHEITHGVIEHSSGMQYNYQPGALNESLGDMAGEALKYFINGANDFLVGSDISKTPGDALRYMCEPTKDGKSIDHVENYRHGMDNHYSSGIYNKAFCTLAQNERWGTGNAFALFARANELYWFETISFHGAACGVEQAARDLGRNVADVTQALAGVGASCKPGDEDEDALPRPLLQHGVAVNDEGTTKDLAYDILVTPGTKWVKLEAWGGEGRRFLQSFGGCLEIGQGPDPLMCTIENPTAGRFHVYVAKGETFSGLYLKATWE